MNLTFLNKASKDGWGRLQRQANFNKSLTSRPIVEFVTTKKNKNAFVFLKQENTTIIFKLFIGYFVDKTIWLPLVLW